MGTAFLLIALCGPAAAPSTSATAGGDIHFDSTLRVVAPKMGDCFAFGSAVPSNLEIGCTNPGHSCFLGWRPSVDVPFELDALSGGGRDGRRKHGAPPARAPGRLLLEALLVEGLEKKVVFD
jgi:hypothetical protein